VKEVLLLTGSSGIAAATARLWAAEDPVFLVSNNAEECEALAASLGEAGFAAADVRDEITVRNAVAACLDRFGRIDALLNIAGAVPQIDLFEMKDEQWRAGLELKFHGARRLTILAWEALKASKGSVVLISGSAALDPKPGFAAVAAINAAIIALAKAFAEQGIKDGIQVNSVVPGPVMTGRRRSFIEKWAPAHGMTVEEATNKFPAEAGISRYGKPEEIAELMAFLVSPGAKWLTGTSVRIDGGEIKGI